MKLSKRNKITLILFTLFFQMDRAWAELSTLVPWRYAITTESIASNLISRQRVLMVINLYCVFLAIGFYRDFSWVFEIIRYKNVKEYISNVYERCILLAIFVGINVVLVQVLIIKGLAIRIDLTNSNFLSFLDLSNTVVEPLYLNISYKLLMLSFFVILVFVMSFFLKYTFFATIFKKSALALSITFLSNLAISLVVSLSWKPISDGSIYTWFVIEIIIFGLLSYKALSNIERRVL